MRSRLTNYEPNNIHGILLQRALDAHRPIACSLELTYRCNYDCKMCYVHMTDAQAQPYGRMRTVEEWLDMARQMKEAGVLYLSLTGGECTQYPGFAQLYTELCKMGFLVDILSNAGAYSPAVKDVFRAYPPQGASITLYGGSNETYAAVTGDPKGFDKVMENIEFLRSIGIRLKLSFTMCKQNVHDYPLVKRITNNLGYRLYLCSDLTPPRNGRISDRFKSSLLTPAERVCINCHPADEVELALKNAKELEKELVNFRLPVPGKELDISKDIKMNGCVGTRCRCVIYWNGDMGHCISLNGHKPAKPFEIGFEAAWQQLQSQVPETFAFPPACRSCEMIEDCKDYCPGRNFEGTGNPLTPDPEVCKYVYLLRKYREKLKNPPELPPSPPCS